MFLNQILDVSFLSAVPLLYFTWLFAAKLQFAKAELELLGTGRAAPSTLRWTGTDLGNSLKLFPRVSHKNGFSCRCVFFDATIL